ncbi:hypothetical protein [Gimesia fumaroli]|jgi:endonuclease III|uniref:Thioredoxin domain-containing protein n=1 Tax=Gimesia fumaroli TaxID=2527976 RepID=A0A518IK26_9PLAN|nr:hypothetical protein [Gimesia fumaroli]QDV53446.1 hypothetical protein Enr17x_55210 [Gimesia fumaroli]
MLSISRISLLLCLLTIAVGCQKGSEPSAENATASSTNESTPMDSEKGAPSETETAANSDEKKEGEPEKPKMPELPKTVKGNWVLMLPQQQQMMPLYLFKITPPEAAADADKKTEEKPAAVAVELISKGAEVAPGKIVSSKATETTVEFEESLLNDGKEFVRLNFQGKLEKGAILGTIAFNNESATPALLLPTPEKDLSRIKEPVPSPGAQELMQAMRSPDAFEQLNDFTQKMKTVPLTMDAYPALIAIGLSQNKEPKTLEEIIARYLDAADTWGKRQQASALVSVSSMLARSDSDSGLATQYLDQLQKLLKDGVTPLKGWDLEIAMAKARVGLKSDKPEQIQAAGKLLQEEEKKHPHNRELLTELVNFEKSHGSVDKAIDHLGVLAGSPLTGRERQLIAVSKQNPGAVKYEHPRDTLTELWKKKHGSTEGLDEYLTKSFKRFLEGYVSKEAKDVDLKKGNRVSLIELFTGASCPPCVAADLATGVIEASFPESKVIVLRYHQHIPAPDPLTNTDSEARFILYNHRGTPSTNLNGQTVPGVAGGVEQVESSYQQILEALIPALSETTDVKIDLSAVAKDGKLDLKANVSGTDKIKEPLRLVAVLAEDELTFDAPNGINVHDMIVRSMLSEPSGFPAVDGKLSLTKSVPLSDFKGRLTDYLSAFEERSGANFTGAPLALEKLHFVVFVQGELSKDVFQVASVPVSGTIEFKKAQPKAAPEKAKPTPAPKPGAKPEVKKDAKPEAKKEAKPESKPEAKKPEAKKEEN